MKHWFLEQREQSVFLTYTDGSEVVNSLTGKQFDAVVNVTCWNIGPERDDALEVSNNYDSYNLQDTHAYFKYMLE